MTETLNNLIHRISSDIQKTADDFKNITVGFAILQGYLEGNVNHVPKNYYKQSQNTLFIENNSYEVIKGMLINLNIKGSVRKRPNGLLELRVWLDGKRCSIYGYTEEELIQKFKLQRRQRKKQAVAPAQNYELLHVWLDKWVETYKTETVKPRTLYAIQRCISKHIKPNFENKALSRLAPLEIEENLKKIASTRMRKYAYQILNESFKKAMVLKLAKENPFALVDVPKHESIKGVPLTPEEQTELKSALKDSKYKYYFLFLLFSGCRRGEGLSARWEDVDFEKRRLLVRGTKTKKSRSFIPLFEELADLLKEIWHDGATGLIFNFTEHQVEIAFKKICPTHRIHDLRHTFATNCIEAGVELKAVQSWLRHTTIGITADIYAHATEKYLDQEAEKLNKR